MLVCQRVVENLLWTIIQLMEEIPNNHLGCKATPVKHGIYHQPQLVCRISEPSRAVKAFPPSFIGCLVISNHFLCKDLTAPSNWNNHVRRPSGLFLWARVPSHLQNLMNFRRGGNSQSVSEFTACFSPPSFFDFPREDSIYVLKISHTIHVWNTLPRYMNSRLYMYI